MQALEAVILHEQPSPNLTVIEKLYDHAEVDFAIALLTADHLSAKWGAGITDMRPRPRQNVTL